MILEKRASALAIAIASAGPDGSFTSQVVNGKPVTQPAATTAETTTVTQPNETVTAAPAPVTVTQAAPTTTQAAPSVVTQTQPAPSSTATASSASAPAPSTDAVPPTTSTPLSSSSSSTDAGLTGPHPLSAFIATLDNGSLTTSTVQPSASSSRSILSRETVSSSASATTVSIEVSASASGSNSSSSSDSPNTGPSTGARAGLVIVAVLAFLAILIGLAAWRHQGKKRRRLEMALAAVNRSSMSPSSFEKKPWLLGSPREMHADSFDEKARTKELDSQSLHEMTGPPVIPIELPLAAMTPAVGRRSNRSSATTVTARTRRWLTNGASTPGSAGTPNLPNLPSPRSILSPPRTPAFMAEGTLSAMPFLGAVRFKKKKSKSSNIHRQTIISQPSAAPPPGFLRPPPPSRLNISTLTPVPPSQIHPALRHSHHSARSLPNANLQSPPVSGAFALSEEQQRRLSRTPPSAPALHVRQRSADLAPSVPTHHVRLRSPGADLAPPPPYKPRSRASSLGVPEQPPVIVLTPPLGGDSPTLGPSSTHTRTNSRERVLRPEGSSSGSETEGVAEARAVGVRRRQTKRGDRAEMRSNRSSDTATEASGAEITILTPDEAIPVVPPLPSSVYSPQSQTRHPPSLASAPSSESSSEILPVSPADAPRLPARRVRQIQRQSETTDISPISPADDARLPARREQQVRRQSEADTVSPISPAENEGFNRLVMRALPPLPMPPVLPALSFERGHGRGGSGSSKDVEFGGATRTGSSSTGGEISYKSAF